MEKILFADYAITWEHLHPVVVFPSVTTTSNILSGLTYCKNLHYKNLLCQGWHGRQPYTIISTVEDDLKNVNMVWSDSYIDAILLPGFSFLYRICQAQLQLAIAFAITLS